jgi:hypothetical protein
MARLVRATHEHRAGKVFMGPPHSASLQRGMTVNGLAIIAPESFAE